MRVFVHRENVRHLQRLLETTVDENERRRLTELLAEETASLRREEAKAKADAGARSWHRI